MDHKLHYLQTKKTARVFTYGELNDQTKYIWFLIHGYAQTADHLIQSFQALGESHFLIAPEALNHFYSRGLSGTPVTSWMTSLMREEQIKDYIHYLDQVYENFKSNHDCKIIVAGFSQGVSTASRWVNNGNIPFHHLVLIAGNIAAEMQQAIPEIIRSKQNLYLYGSNDSLIKKDQLLSIKDQFSSKTEFMEFNGKHEVNEETILCIKEWLRQLD